MNNNKQPTLDNSSDWFEEALAAQDRNQIKEAITAYLNTLQSDPQHFAATYNLATLYHASKQLDLARQKYIDAIKINPASALPYKGLGDVFFTLNDIEQAFIVYNQALKIDPMFAEIWHNIGLIEQHRQNLGSAYKAYRKAVELRPDHKSALDNLIKLEAQTGQTQETINFLTDLNHKYPENLNLKLALAEIFSNHNQSEKTLNLIRSALVIDKRSGEAFNLLGLILLRRGEAEAARQNFRKAHNLAPSSLKIHSNLLYSAIADPTATPKGYRHEAALWWRQHGAAMASKTVCSHQRPLEKDRPLRLGFISGDFHRHSVSYFFLPLLSNLPQTLFATFCYSDSTTDDDYNRKIKEQSRYWRPIYGLDSGVVTQMIAADKIDILIELSGHTANNRLPVVAQKPAPVQFSWLGYPASTGIANGTFRLTDNITVPEEFDEHYSETLTYLETPFLCYAPPPEARDLLPEKTPGASDNIVFASFNNAAKINQNVVETWSHILKKTPGSRLLIKTRTLQDISTASQLREKFANCGVNPERISIQGKNFTTAGHFAAYNQVDIALDPFPYNGTTTTCDALWMGTPVIAMRGKSHADRVGASLLQAIGCPELVAENCSDYIDIAVSLAQNITELARYHQKIRTKMQKSSLMNAKKFTENFNRAIISRWEEWRSQRLSILQRLVLKNHKTLGLPPGTEKLLSQNRSVFNLLTKSLENNDSAKIFLKLGQEYANEDDFEPAYMCFREAIAVEYDNFVTHFAVAFSLKNLGRNDEALHHYRKALALNPQLTDAAVDLSKILQEQNESAQAVEILLETDKLAPDDSDLIFQLANIYYDQNQLEKAYKVLERCVKLAPKRAGIWNNLGYLMYESGKSEEAIKCYRKALSFDPDLLESQTNLMWSLAQNCAWPELNEFSKKVNSLPPILSIFLHNDSNLNLQSAKNALQKRLTKENFQMSQPTLNKSRKNDLIKIGYLSPDFRDHPVAHNLLNLFRLHDRDRFQVTAYSCGRDDKSKYRRQIINDCDNFIDLQKLNDLESAKKIHADKIDILIELMGHTRDNRLAICAFRPAPIQVSYLGYPGTTGAEFIDYLIADQIVIPPKDKIHYSEKIIYLPNCFMVADRAPIGPLPQRAECGLPETGFVFCSFNTPFKIEPVMFKVWMDILSAVSNSCLWLREGSERYEYNLKAEAKKHGIAPERLIFAPRVPEKSDHLARLQRADLALDTRIYNGHTTTLDALWAGVPVLTSRGSHFASRVSDSNLKAIGLEEMIAEDLEGYREMAIELANSREKLEKIRQKLHLNRSTHPLFDTETTVRNLENAYFEIRQSKLEGEISN